MIATLPERVLITGASSGIGLELAREFARHGHPLVITATNEAELGLVAEEFTDRYGVDILFVAQDLTRPKSGEALFEALQEKGITIDVLANNAGIGKTGKFAEQNLDDQLAMIQLNILAVTVLTRLFLPGMISRGHGRILFTASIAGFMPAPLMATYHATKAYVLSLSEALSTETAETGVTVTALCPGATDTDFFPRAGAVDSMMFQKGNVMAPQEVAAAGYKALMAGERVHIAGGLNQAMIFSRRFLPESFLAKMTEAFYRDVKPEDHQRESGDIAEQYAAKSI